MQLQNNYTNTQYHSKLFYIFRNISKDSQQLEKFGLKCMILHKLTQMGITVICLVKTSSQ